MQACIVGAGIMGSMLALALHNAGWQVIILDQNEGNTNCSFVAAGLLAPFSELDRSPLLVFNLGQESIKTGWPDIMKQLPEIVYFQKSGSVVVSHPNDQAEWKHYNRRISSQLNGRRSYFQKLDKGALIQLEPALTKFETAYYFPDEAQIDCQSLMRVLKKYLLDNGMKYLINTPVLSLKPGRVTTERQTFLCDMVFDCRGLGAASVFDHLRALRGELIWLYAPDVELKRPVRLLHPRYNLYIVPRPGNIYIIGSSEIEAEDYSTISVRTALELLTAAYYVNAGFAEARVLKTLSHCRPTLANHLPRIKYQHGLMAVNGLYRHGYLIAPALAAEIVGRLGDDQNVQYPELWRD